MPVVSYHVGFLSGLLTPFTTLRSLLEAGGSTSKTLKSGTLIVNDTEVASDHYWSVERESTDKPTTSAWVADEYVRDYVAAAETVDGWF